MLLRIAPVVLILSLIIYETSAQINGYALQKRLEQVRNAEERIKKIGYIKDADYEQFHLQNLLRKVKFGPNVFKTTECSQDMSMLVESVERQFKNILNFGSFDNMTHFDSNVTLFVLDSSAKLGTGILRGHLFFYGLFSECRNIDYKIEGSSRHWKGDYFRVYVDIGFGNYRDEGSCVPTHQFGFDICLPMSCDSDEIRDILRGTVDLLGNDPICRVKNVNDGVTKRHKPAAYIVGIFMLLIFALCFISGFYDYFLHEYVKDAPFTKGLGFKLFISFSLYRNVSEIFSTGSAKKAGQIGPIHCIRFVSMCWVIMGHIVGLFMEYSANPLDVLAITQDTSSEFLTNAYYAVDSFFFLSGLLLGFIWFKDFNKNKKRAMSPIAWAMFYIHRLIRLSPPYYILILFFTFVYLPWLHDMPTYMHNEEPDNCVDNWWVNLLYLNNFINFRKPCYLPSWYLATDLQIYIFAPLILVPLAMNWIVGLVVSFVILALSSAANIFTIYHFYFPPSDYSLGPRDPRMYEKTDFDHYTMYVYDAPWIRCQIYIIGILVGWFLQNNKTFRVNRILNFVLWLLSGTVMLTVALGLHKWTNNSKMSMFWIAMYSAFSKPAWGLGLSWIIISSFYGYGGPINQFMSWNIWVPLGRLTYCAYLIHIVIVMYYLGLDKSEIVFSNFTDLLLGYVFPCIFVTFFFAIFWSSAFEMSLGKVETLLIGGLRRPPPKPEVAATKLVENGNGTTIEKEVHEIPIPTPRVVSGVDTIAPSSGLILPKTDNSWT